MYVRSLKTKKMFIIFHNLDKTAYYTVVGFVDYTGKVRHRITGLAFCTVGIKCVTHKLWDGSFCCLSTVSAFTIE